MLNIITNGYVLPFISKSNLVRAPLIRSGYKALQKELVLTSCIQSLLSRNAIEKVENVKSPGFYSRLFLVPKPQQRWRPVIDLSRLNKFLLVERFKMETPVFQFTSLPFGLATAPQVLKEVTRWIINPTQVFSFVGYKYHLDSALVKPTQERWRKLQDLILRFMMFDVTNWVACLNRENGPGGTPSHETLLVSPQGALEISPVVGQPPSLDRNHFSTPRVVAESHKCNERCRPSSQRPQYPTLYRRLKRRPGRSLRANLCKRSVVIQEKRLHINVLELKTFLCPFKGSTTSVKTKQCWLLQTTQQ